MGRNKKPTVWLGQSKRKSSQGPKALTANARRIGDVRIFHKWKIRQGRSEKRSFPKEKTRREHRLFNST
jgi:hypothetical protein